MTTTSSKPLAWKRRHYYGASEIGFTSDGTFVLSLFTYKPPHENRGNYFTTIQISPADYRRENKTRAAYCDDGEALIIFDDWGRAHRIAAGRDLLDVLCAECAAQELPQKEQP